MFDQLGLPLDYGRTHRMRMVAEPDRLASIGEDVFGREQFLGPRAAAAWASMIEVAAQHGIKVQAVSAFRSIDYQFGIVRRKIEKGQSVERILSVSAPPGFSEHHGGHAIDVTQPGCQPLEEEFERTPAYAWLQRHAGDFGFRLSFPRGNRHGVVFEPWHWAWSP
jgi:D-alanyl-D-alanine carboxypeptidase